MNALSACILDESEKKRQMNASCSRMDKEQPPSALVPIPLAKSFGQNAFALVKFIQCGGYF